MSAPRWSKALLRWIAPSGREKEITGDLEEAHRARVRHRGRLVAYVLTGLEALDMAWVLLRERIGKRRGARKTDGPKGRSLVKSTGGFGFSWLDFKLGLRMLVKHPGLTVVGVIAISFGVMVGAVVFQLMTDLYHPSLGLPESDRVVELEQGEDRRVLHDFAIWRQELESVDDVSAYGTVRRNLVTEGRGGEPITVAVINASAFRIARVAPLLGRTLVDADEEPSAAPVLVLGYDVWQARFAGDPGVIGREVLLGATPSTVVGVMPEGFAFPMAHGLWAPLRLNVLDYERGQGPTLDVLGRLAPGVSLRQAQAELTTLGLRAAADFPETNQRRRPVIRPYRGGIIHGSELLLVGAYSMVILLPVLVLILVCANIALMVFARTAARESEIVVRSALGASRGRVLMQLFVEALVLTSVAAVVGLVAADFAMGHVMELLDAEADGYMPYWFHDGLTTTTVLYAGVFTVLGALFVGVVPALKVTGSGMRPRLQKSTAGGGGFQMGGLWTGVIVAQVAVTIALVPFVVGMVTVMALTLSSDVGLPSEEYLSVWLATDLETTSAAAVTAPNAERAVAFHASYTELKERLQDEPEVRGVTMASPLPGSGHVFRRIEMDGQPMPPSYDRLYVTRTASVDPDFFDVLGAPILSGRSFDSSDLESDERVVIVNQAFVLTILGDRNPIGRRVRFPTPVRSGRSNEIDEEEAPWYEIVGVVRDVGITMGLAAMEAVGPDDDRLLYLPLAPGSAYPVGMVVHAAGAPESLAPRLRALASAVDPSLQLRDLRSLNDAIAAGLRPVRSGTWALVLTGALALLLSNAGIYSALSFAVSRRTREIGVRVALGAGQRRIVFAVLRHSLVQVTLGVLAGAGLLFVIVFIASSGRFLSQVASSGRAAEAILASLAYLLLMVGVCALACIVPTQRALRIEPTEALRADG